MTGRNWFNDFEFGGGVVRVRKTGAVVPIEGGVLQEVAAWFGYFFAVRAAAPAPGRFTIAFAPDRARPWYLIWPAVRLAGGRIVDDPAHADMVFHFDDSTESHNPPPARRRPDARLMNFGCTSVAKSAVASAFEQVFGYPLSLDPRTHVGPAVEKSERNGAHDGRIVQCPMEPRAGRVYQRLIESVGRDGLVEDLRTPMVGGRPICVFRKRRKAAERFANHNVEVLMARAADIYTDDEMAKLAAFARVMGLDWGGIDVLRDSRDGRLYVVDVNKTDMGPPIALPLKDKMAATRLLAAALRGLVTGKDL